MQASGSRKTVLIGDCRQFRPEDADACCAIIRSNLEGDRSVSEDLRRKFLLQETPELMISRAARCYVAVFLGEFGVGAVGAVDLNEIGFLAVAPSLQRQGIGRRVLRHLEFMVPPAFFRDVFVYASPASVGFYRACGYKEGGEHILEVRGMPVPTIFMSKLLRK